MSNQMNRMTKMNLKKVNQLFPLTNSIFSKMNYTFLDMTLSQMDMLWVVENGERIVSPFVTTVLGDNEELTSENLQMIATMTLNYYKSKWDKQKAIYNIEYNPILNFLNEKTGTQVDDGSKTDTTSGTLSGQNSQLTSGTNTTTLSGSDTKSTEKDGTITITDNLVEEIEYDTEEDANRTDNLTSTTTLGSTKTDTTTNNLSRLETRNLSGSSSGTENDKIYGFNSSQSVGDKDIVDSGSTTDTGTVTTDDTGTSTSAVVGSGSDSTANTGTQRNKLEKTGTDTKTNTGTETSVDDTDISELTTYGKITTERPNLSSSGTKSETTSGSLSSSTSNEREFNITNRGSIGSITYQQMLREEIDLWKWKFIQEVLDDVKQFLTLPIYN